MKTRRAMAQNRNTEELFEFWARLTFWAVRTSKNGVMRGYVVFFGQNWQANVPIRP
jgi:hypothetical protein